jgi:hypothetical protein
MVTHSLAEYEARAIEIARTSAACAAAFRENRLSAIARHTRCSIHTLHAELRRPITRMWHQHANGESGHLVAVETNVKAA